MTEINSTKKKGGCKKAFLIFIGITFGLFLLISLAAIFSSDDKATTESTTSTKDSIEVVANQEEIETQKLKEELEAENSKKVEQLKSKFNEKKDEFSTTSWIQPKSRPQYTNQNGFYCYFAKDGNNVGNFRFVGQYVDDNWLFIRELKFNIDGDILTYYPKEMKRDNADGLIWEWFDDNISISDVVLIDKISKAKSVKIRFEGRQYRDDKVMSAKNLQSIKDTYEYYQALGGQFN